MPLSEEELSRMLDGAGGWKRTRRGKFIEVDEKHRLPGHWGWKDGFAEAMAGHYYAISELLRDGTGRAHEHILALEEELQTENEKLKSEGWPVRAGDSKTTVYGLLNHVLTRNERAWGFETSEVIEAPNSSPPKDHPLLLFQILDKDEWAQLLKIKAHFKDIGAGKDHGEYSHRIQWYIIGRAFAASQPRSPRLSSEIFASLANYPPYMYQSEHMGSPLPAPLTGLWDCLVDRLPRSEVVAPNESRTPLWDRAFAVENDQGTDFRCPNHLNHFIMNDSSLSILGGLLKARYEKRSRQERSLKGDRELIGREVIYHRLLQADMIVFKANVTESARSSWANLSKHLDAERASALESGWSPASLGELEADFSKIKDLIDEYIEETRDTIASPSQLPT